MAWAAQAARAATAVLAGRGAPSQGMVALAVWVAWAVPVAMGCSVLAAVWVASRVYRRTERIYATRGSRYLTSLMHLSSLWLVAISATLSTVSRSPRPEWALATSLVGWVVPAVAPLLRRPLQEGARWVAPPRVVEKQVHSSKARNGFCKEAFNC